MQHPTTHFPRQQHTTMLLHLVMVDAALQSEERRARALQPYLVSTPKRGIVGNSKYADRLRRQVGDCYYVKLCNNPGALGCSSLICMLAVESTHRMVA
jgi:transcriptional regulator with AAA-type ATPase domain